MATENGVRGDAQAAVKTGLQPDRGNYRSGTGPGTGSNFGSGFGSGWTWGLAAAAILAAGLLPAGCASMRIKQVAAWEAAGDDVALRRSLEDGSDPVRQAAAAAFLRYAAYETGRPTVLALLNKNPTAEAKEVKRKLFGVPPQTTPDPHGAGAGPGQVVIYLYRPADDSGEARWLRIDDGRSVRLRPGRFLRYEAAVGSHQLAIELPHEEVPPTDDPNEAYGQLRRAAPLRMHIATPTAGVYFVRELAQKGARQPEVKVMPVPPGLAAVMPLAPAERADCDAAGF